MMNNNIYCPKSNWSRQLTTIDEYIFLAERRLEMTTAELDSLKRERKRLIQQQLDDLDE